MFKQDQKLELHAGTTAPDVQEDPEDVRAAMQSVLRGKPKHIPDEPGRRTTAVEAAEVISGLEAAGSNPSMDDVVKLSTLKLLKDFHQGKKKRNKKPGLAQLRGGQLQQRGCRVDYVFKRRERNRSSGKVEGSHGSKPRGLPKPHGKQDDESRKMHRDKVHPRSAGDWRVCPSRVCGDPEAHGGEQASPGEVTYSEDDGCYGTVFDRRELDSGSKIDWRRGTTMGALERPGLGCPEASIRLNEAGRVHLVGGDDQRIEGGGMADEVKVKSKATRKVARMIRVRLQRPNEKKETQVPKF